MRLRALRRGSSGGTRRDATWALTMTETEQVLQELRADLDEAVRLFSEKKYENAAELFGDALEVL